MATVSLNSNEDESHATDADVLGRDSMIQWDKDDNNLLTDSALQSIQGLVELLQIVTLNCTFLSLT